MNRGVLDSVVLLSILLVFTVFVSFGVYAQENEGSKGGDISVDDGESPDDGSYSGGTGGDEISGGDTSPDTSPSDSDSGGDGGGDSGAGTGY